MDSPRKVAARVKRIVNKELSKKFMLHLLI